MFCHYRKVGQGKNMFTSPPTPHPRPPKPEMPFGGDIFMTYLRNIYEWELESEVGETYFITTFMKHIQFCILTENEKANSSQIYQICALTVFIQLLLSISVVFSSFWCKKYIIPKEKGNLI